MTDCLYCGIVYIGKICPNCGNINRYKVLQSKIMLSLIVIFMAISMISALGETSFQLEKSQPITIGAMQLDYNPIWEKYAPLQIETWWGLPLISQPVFDGAITSHTDSCSDNCEDIIPYHLYTDSVLVSGYKTYTLNLDEKGNEVSRIEQPIRSLQLFLENGTRKVNNNYQTCNGTGSFLGNGTEIQNCYIGTHEETILIPYQIGDIVSAGDGVLHVKGSKKPERTIDYILEMQGITLDSWAVWGASTLTTDRITTGGPSGNHAVDHVYRGINITMNKTEYLYAVQMGSSPTPCTNFVIKDAQAVYENSTSLYSQNFTGLNMTLTTPYLLEAGKSYHLLSGVQPPAADCQDSYSNVGITTIFPEFSVKRVYDGFSPYAGDLSYTYNIFELTFQNATGNVTLNSPADSLSSSNQTIIFNCSAAQPSASLVNISLWTNETGILKVNSTNSITGNSNSTTFSINFANGGYSWGCQACDSDGDCGYATANRTFTLDANAPATNSATYNATSYETSQEGFILNATKYSSANLIYNGFSYSTVINSADPVNNISSVIITLPSTGNKSFFWALNGGLYNTSTYYQNVLPISLALCNTTNNVTYLNITFADELTSAAMNGTLSPLNVNYSIGNGSVFKTYSLTNTTTINPNYPLCFTPGNQTISASMTASSSMTNYVVRNWINNYTLTNATTTKIVYLLGSADGVYQNIVVTSNSGATLQNAVVTASTATLGVVNYGTTDSNGALSLWLNPNVAHTLLTTLTGYPSDSRVINPSPTTTVYITLGGSTTYPANLSSSYTEGVTYSVIPVNETLINGTSYNFGFTITSSLQTITQFGYTLYNDTGLLLSSNVTANGGTSSANYNVGNNTQITMYPFYIINGSRIDTAPYRWIVLNGDTSYSVLFLRDRISTYLNSGFFGLKKGIGLNLFCFLIIFLTIGALSWKYSINEPLIISLATLFLVWIFEKGLNLIQISVGISLTAWVAIITLALLIKEGLKLI